MIGCRRIATSHLSLSNSWAVYGRTLLLRVQYLWVKDLKDTAAEINLQRCGPVQRWCCSSGGMASCVKMIKNGRAKSHNGEKWIPIQYLKTAMSFALSLEELSCETFQHFHSGFHSGFYWIAGNASIVFHCGICNWASAPCGHGKGGMNGLGCELLWISYAQC